MEWLTFFLLFLKASLLSTGGRGPFPYLYTDLISRGWAIGPNFAEALTVGEISPGPSGLWVVSLGYLTGGLAGALLASVAIVIPPLLVLVIARIHGRLKSFRATKGVLDGLIFAIIGSGAVVLIRLFVSNGVNAITVGIALITAALTFTGRVPTWLLLVGAGVAGIIFLK